MERWRKAAPLMMFCKNWVCAIVQLIWSGSETEFDMVVCAIFQLGYARHIIKSPMDLFVGWSQGYRHNGIIIVSNKGVARKQTVT